MKELLQLHSWNALSPVRGKYIKEEQKETALELSVLLKEKRDRTIKGRAVLYKKKPQDTINQKYATSPTLLMEAVLLTAVIDVLEGCELAVVYILVT